MKKIFIAFVAMLCLTSLAACGTPEETSSSSIVDPTQIVVNNATGQGSETTPYEIILEEEEEIDVTLTVTPEEVAVLHKFVKKDSDVFVDIGDTDEIGIEIIEADGINKFTITAINAGTYFVKFYLDDAYAYLKVLVSEKQPVAIQGMDTWVVSSYENVFRDKVKAENSHNSANLVMAKNEYESFQVLMRANQNFEIIGVTFTDLVKDDKIISNGNLEYKFVEYQFFASNTSSLDFKTAVRYGPNFYPDALSNETGVAVDKETTQPIWMTVFVPKDTDSGIYLGQAVINTNLGDITVNISVEVNDVVVPDSNESAYSIYFWQLILGAGFGISYADSHPSDTMVKHFGHERWTEEWWDIVEDIADVMKESRINQLYVQTVQLLLDGGTTIDSEGNYNFNWSKFDEYIQYFIDRDIIKGMMGYMMMTGEQVNAIYNDEEGKPRTGTLVYGTPEADNWFNQYIPALNEHLVEKGWADMWVQSIRDEPQNATDLAKYTYVLNKIRTLGPQIRVAETITNTNIADYMLKNIDVLIPLINTHNESQVMFDSRLREDQDILTYTCVVPGGTYLNRFIDKPVWHGRSLAWYNYNKDVTGFLHWGLMAWYRPITDFALGDTASIYPDIANNTIKTTIRLAALRDGAEDYDLLKVLEDINPTLAKTLADMIAHDANQTYSKNIEEMINVRKLLVRAASGNYKAIDNITFDEDELTLSIGDSMQLEAIIHPQDALIKDVIWETSDGGVVTIDENGEIYVVNYGSATITVTSVIDPSVKAIIKINVPYGEEGITIYPVEDAVVGNASAVDTNFGNQVYLAVISSDTIGRKSYVKFKLGGIDGDLTKAVLRLYAYQINKDATRTIKVYTTSTDWDENMITWNNAPLGNDLITSLTINNDTGAHDKTGQWFEIDVTDYVNVGQPYFSILLENDGPASNDSGVYFASTDRPEIQQWPRLELEGSLTYSEPLVSQIDLSDTELSLNIGEYADVIATPLPEYASNKDVTWSSNDETVAIVSNNGLVYAVGSGTTKIIVRSVENPDVFSEINVEVIEDETKKNLYSY